MAIQDCWRAYDNKKEQESIRHILKCMHIDVVDIAHSPEEQKTKMESYCKKIPTEQVVCYCTSCARGLTLGGKQGIHLLDLLFDPYHNHF